MHKQNIVYIVYYREVLSIYYK